MPVRLVAAIFDQSVSPKPELQIAAWITRSCTRERPFWIGKNSAGPDARPKEGVARVGRAAEGLAVVRRVRHQRIE